MRNDPGREGAGATRATNAHLPALAEFFRRVWDSNASAKRVEDAWEGEGKVNFVEPGQPPPVFVFLKDGAVIGYLSTIPARFSIEGDRKDGYWLKGLWVLPEHRGGPVGFHLVRAATSELDPLAALAVAEPARRLFQAVGFEDVCGPPNYFWPLRPRHLFQQLDPDRVLRAGASFERRAWRWIRRVRLAGLAGSALTALLRLSRSTGQRSSWSLVERWEQLDRAQVDSLWRTVEGQRYCGLVRDAHYLRWRYARRHSEGYRLVAVSEPRAGEEGAILAVAVAKLPTLVSQGRFEGVRVGWLSELIFSPEREKSRCAAHTAIERVERILTDSGGDVLLHSFSGPGYDRLFRERRHLRRSATMHLLVKGLDVDGGGEPKAANQERNLSPSWFVARGDGDSDGLS